MIRPRTRAPRTWHNLKEGEGRYRAEMGSLNFTTDHQTHMPANASLMTASKAIPSP